MGLSVSSDGSYPFGYSEGNDFEKTLTIPTIDFGTIHLYPSQCKWARNFVFYLSFPTLHSVG